MALAAGGKEFFTGEANGDILRWDATTGKELGTLDLEGTSRGFSRGQVHLSRDGSRALCSDGSGGLGVYEGVIRSSKRVGATVTYKFAFDVGDTSYVAFIDYAQEMAKFWDQGDTVPVLYDPEDPTRCCFVYR
jgi:hypothetical protein